MACGMTASSTERGVGPFIGPSASAMFPFPFMIFFVRHVWLVPQVPGMHAVLARVIISLNSW